PRAKVSRRRIANQPFRVIRQQAQGWSRPEILVRTADQLPEKVDGSCGRRNYSKLVDHLPADPAPPTSAAMMTATDFAPRFVAQKKMQPVATTGTRIFFPVRATECHCGAGVPGGGVTPHFFKFSVLFLGVPTRGDAAKWLLPKVFEAVRRQRRIADRRG